MVDRDGNGIDDDRERPRKPTTRTTPSNKPKPLLDVGGALRSADQAARVFGSVARDVPGRIWNGAAGALGLPQIVLGGGGSAPRERSAPQGGMWKAPGGLRATAPQAEDAQKTFADYLTESLSWLGEPGSVNYDPQRQTLRGNASEADARLEAMYRQLRGSIDADAPVLQQAYGEAIDSTAKTAQTAQSQIQGASDAASSRNSQVLANLGIEQAQGNIIQEGRDLETQTAGAIADSAGLGQAAGNRLVSNQATALQHNTNIGNAAGLEGNLQRAANQAKLQSLLAEIDMQEQSQNAQLASQGGDRLRQAFDFASEMAGFDRYNQEREDELQMSAQEMAAKQRDPLPNFDQMIQALAARGIAIPEDPADLAKLLDSSRRYSF